MKTILLMFAFSSALAVSAQEETTLLPSFNKIVVSPRISVVLIKGEKESVRLLCNNISPEKVNIKVHGKKLLLYLDHARMLEKQVFYTNVRGKRGMYADVSVTAYVTYKEIKALEIRGQSEISVQDELVTNKLKLRGYGECEIDLAKLNVTKFKASLYGRNKLRIRDGVATHQVYRIYGETKIDTKGLLSSTASVRMFGEGKVSLNATDEVFLTAFGEPQFALRGNAILGRVVIGRASIYREE